MIVKLGALGDILMATPLLTALRQAYPQAHLTWVVEQANVQAIDANPFVDEIILWNSGYLRSLLSTRPRNWIKNRFGLRWLVERLRLTRRLRSRFNSVITFHPEHWQFLLDAIDPKVSVGVFQSSGEKKRDYTSRYTKAYTEKEFPVGQTDIYLLPTEALGLPPVTDKQMVMGYTAEDANSVEGLLLTNRVGSKFAVLAPLTTWPSKCWPKERWSALGDALVEQGNQVVLIGTKGEAEAVKRIAAGMRASSVMLAGALSFREVGALIARASLCISSDSGPMHVAAAVNTPYVSLFGPTLPARWAPVEGTGRVLLHPVPCGPCMEQVCLNPPETQMECMRLLTVSEVLAAALSALTGETVLS